MEYVCRYIAYTFSMVVHESFEGQRIFLFLVDTVLEDFSTRNTRGWFFYEALMYCCFIEKNHNSYFIVLLVL